MATESNTVNENKNYVGFWDRMNAETITLFFLFIFSICLIPLFTSEFTGAVILLIICSIMLSIFLVFRKKFVHIIIVDDDNNLLILSDHCQRIAIKYTPIIAYFTYCAVMYAPTYNIVSSNHVGCVGYEAICDNESVYLTMTFYQILLRPLPFLVLIYTINWIPFFLKTHQRCFHDIWSQTHVVYSEEKEFSIARLIFKAPLFYLSIQNLLILLGISAWVAYSIPSVPLNSKVEEFFYDDPIKPISNIHIALAGFHMPIKDGDDFYQHGLNIIIGEYNDLPHIDIPKDDDDENKKTPTTPPISNEEKKKFIDRYISLYDYDNYSVGDSSEYNDSKEILRTQKHIGEHWLYLTENNQGSKAIKWWIKDTNFIQKMLSGKSPIFSKVFWMTAYKENLNILTNILESDPNLITTYKYDIIETLRREKLLNIEDTWRADYNVLKHMNVSKWPKHFLTMKPNKTRNEFMELAQDMITVFHAPIKNMRHEFNVIKDKHDCLDLDCAPYNFSDTPVMTGPLKGVDIYIEPHILTAKQRSLILWINAKEQKISNDKVEEFIFNTTEDLYDPFTYRPFRWDNQKSNIYFTTGDHKTGNRINTSYGVPYVSCPLNVKYWIAVIGRDKETDLPLVSICLKEPISTFSLLTEMAEQANYNHQIDIGIAKTTIFAVKEVPFDEVIQSICKQENLDCTIKGKLLTVKEKQ